MAWGEGAQFSLNEALETPSQGNTIAPRGDGGLRWKDLSWISFLVLTFPLSPRVQPGPGAWSNGLGIRTQGLRTSQPCPSLLGGPGYVTVSFHPRIALDDCV